VEGSAVRLARTQLPLENSNYPSQDLAVFPDLVRLVRTFLHRDQNGRGSKRKHALDLGTRN
jgi:hypothetical protein